MNTIVIYLSMFLVLLLNIGAPNPAFASGGGGWEPARHFDSDLDRANQAIKAKEYEQAISYLNAVVARDEQNAEAHNLLGYSERMHSVSFLACFHPSFTPLSH